MTSLTGLSPNNPRDYVGPNVALCVCVTRNRAPTGADYRQPETGKLYPFDTYWLVGKNPTTGVQGDLWYLSKIAANIAYWIKLGTSSGGPLLAVNVQAATPPGVDPVQPDVGGLMTINGAVVANHSVVLETHTRALNEFNLEIQYATSAAASDGTKSGVAHFDSTDFTVSAAGFVALSGTGSLQSLTPDEDFDGTAATPILPQAGNINILGSNPSFANVTDTYNTTGTSAGNLDIEHRAWLTGFVVDPSTTRGTRGTFSTIAAAIAAAVSGQTIFIRPGTYTENLTLKAGVNLTAFEADSSLNGSGHVIISGNATMTTAGSVTLTGIQLQTNAAAFLTVSGSAASIVNLNNCYLNCTNSTGIIFSSSSSSALINIFRCNGNLGTTGIGLYTSTSPGSMVFEYCYFNNTGISVTASNTSVGVVFFIYSTADIAFSTSGTGSFLASHSILNIGVISDTTALTTSGTSIINSVMTSTVSTGAASAVSVGAGTIVTMSNTTIESNNTNAITGAGTLLYGLLSFTGTSSLINTTTQTRRNVSAGGISFDGGVNTLSNYTVGTFTPTAIGGTTAGTTTYTNQTGYYIRVGNLVTVQASVAGSAATGTGFLTLGGLPFTIKNQANGNAYGSVINASVGQTWPVGTTSLALSGLINTTTAFIYCSGTGTSGSFQPIENIVFNYQYTLTYEI